MFGNQIQQVPISSPRYGLNEVPEEKEPLWKMFLKQFTGPMQIMIECAALFPGFPWPLLRAQISPLVMSRRRWGCAFWSTIGPTSPSSWCLGWSSTRHLEVGLTVCALWAEKPYHQFSDFQRKSEKSQKNLKNVKFIKILKISNFQKNLKPSIKI